MRGRTRIVEKIEGLSFDHAKLGKTGRWLSKASLSLSNWLVQITAVILTYFHNTTTTTTTTTTAMTTTTTATIMTEKRCKDNFEGDGRRWWSWPKFMGGELSFETNQICLEMNLVYCEMNLVYCETFFLAFEMKWISCKMNLECCEINFAISMMLNGIYNIYNPNMTWCSCFSQTFGTLNDYYECAWPSSFEKKRLDVCIDRRTNLRLAFTENMNRWMVSQKSWCKFSLFL